MTFTCISLYDNTVVYLEYFMHILAAHFILKRSFIARRVNCTILSVKLKSHVDVYDGQIKSNRS